MPGANPRIRPRWAGVALLALVLASPAAEPRPYDEVRARGEISVCANPNALPYASNRPDLPGFQIEIARAIARRLDVQLRVEWIVPRIRANTVDCDMLMDTIALPNIQGPAIKLSVPHQTGGVALAFAPGQPTVPHYKDLQPDMRVGVMMNSLASLIVSKTGARMVPFGFEDDMLAAVANGEINAGALSTAAIGYYNHAPRPQGDAGLRQRKRAGAAVDRRGRPAPRRCAARRGGQRRGDRADRRRNDRGDLRETASSTGAHKAAARDARHRPRCRRPSGDSAPAERRTVRADHIAVPGERVLRRAALRREVRRGPARSAGGSPPPTRSCRAGSRRSSRARLTPPSRARRELAEVAAA